MAESGSSTAPYKHHASASLTGNYRQDQRLTKKQQEFLRRLTKEMTEYQVRSEIDGQIYGPGEVTILLLELAEDPDDHGLVERAVWLGFEVRPAGMVL